MLDFLTNWQKPRAEHLEDDDRAFLEQLRAEAETTLIRAQASDPLRKTYDDLIRRIHDHDVNLARADLYALDRLLIALVPLEDLRAEAPGLYRRYCEERGEAMDPNDPAMRSLSDRPEDQVSEPLLRARVQQLLRSLHWSYAFGPLREKKRVGLIKESMVLMIGATVILAAILPFLTQWPFFAMLATVVYAGVMGGAVSCTLRISEVPSKGDALGSIHALKNSRYVLYFAPLTGAVFAVVTMLLFMGNVLAGGIFPKFESAATAGATAQWSFTQWFVPASSKDIALLLLWCFIAGFAERFVPDTISDLIRRASAKSKAEEPSAPVVVTQTVEKVRDEASTQTRETTGG